MKKILALIAAGVFLAGCAADGRPSVANKNDQSSYSSIKNGVSAGSVNGNFVQSDACNNGNIAMCRNFADSMYNKGDFASAIVAYNAACMQLNIPSCMKMGSMFEKGEGVEKNINNAIDLYMRSCYHGDSQGCKNMRRLGYNG